jgi:hypothetical protein
MLLKVGRHLRPAGHFKLIISREEGEGRFLQGYRKQFVHLVTRSHPGPLALVDGRASEQDLQLAARLVARYSQGRDAAHVEVEICEPAGPCRVVEVVPMPASDIPGDWVL